MARLPIGIVGMTPIRQRNIIIIGLVAIILGNIIPAVRDIGFSYFICRIFVGFAASTWVSYTSCWINMNERDGITQATSQIYTVYNVAICTAFILGSLFFDLIGMRSFLVISSGFAAVGLACIIIGRPIHVKDCGLHKIEEFHMSHLTIFIKNRALLHYSIESAFLQCIIFTTAMGFSSNYAQSIGANGFQIGLIYIIFSVFGILATMALGTWPVSEDKRQILTKGSFLVLALYCFSVTFLEIQGVYVVSAIAGVGRSVASSTIMAGAVQDFDNNERSIAMGMYQTIYSIALIIGPILIGMCIDFFRGYTEPFILVGMIAIMAILVEIRYNKRTSRKKYSF